MSALTSIERNEEGFMVNPAVWNKEIAAEIAKEEGIDELSEEQWRVIEFARANAENSGASPTLRQITSGAGVSTKDLFKLFPKGPAKKIAKIAGLGKPEGCV